MYYLLKPWATAGVCAIGKGIPLYLYTKPTVGNLNAFGGVVSYYSQVSAVRQRSDSRGALPTPVIPILTLALDLNSSYLFMCSLGISAATSAKGPLSCGLSSTMYWSVEMLYPRPGPFEVF
ncbi:unnamed protein product [Eretmochelys imbricata]